MNQTVNAIVADDSHLTVRISQACYDAVMKVVETASARGLEDSFEFWLSRLARQHANVQMKLWARSDAATAVSRAKAGDSDATVKVLTDIGIPADIARELLKAVKK